MRCTAPANPVQDIERLAAFAHRFHARVFITLNTILRDDELEEARRMAWQMHEAGADALIVQDMGLLELDLPPLELHASTQCDIRTPQKAKFLADAGFSQMVLARELSLPEIIAIREKVGAHDTAPILEFFIHGALCVAFSGQCYISHAHTGRSANRGECSQACRLPYNLEDKQGRIVAFDKHLLSMKDNDQSANLRALADAGIRSFKIEGRLKDAPTSRTPPRITGNCSTASSRTRRSTRAPRRAAAPARSRRARRRPSTAAPPTTSSMAASPTSAPSTRPSLRRRGQRRRHPHRPRLVRGRQRGRVCQWRRHFISIARQEARRPAHQRGASPGRASSPTRCRTIPRASSPAPKSTATATRPSNACWRRNPPSAASASPWISTETADGFALTLTDEDGIEGRAAIAHAKDRRRTPSARWSP
jgi:hypothetical protein